MNVFVIVVAAGRGVRAGEGLPKAYRPVAGQPMLARSMMAFEACGARIVPIIHPDDEALYRSLVDTLPETLRTRLLPPVHGGATRQQSVYQGLKALEALARPEDIILIHDAARPFVSPGLIERVIEAVRKDGAAVPLIPVTDTIKQIDTDEKILATPERPSLKAAQTPQGFRYQLVLKAHELAAAENRQATDDSSLLEAAAIPVTGIAGEPENRKMTLGHDFASPELWETRTGLGFDVHAFGPGDHVWLGGVKIAHDRGIIAHSDGDVILHALTDAVLGALAEGDIGTHFPPSEASWKDASSDRFLSFAIERLRERAGELVLLDITLLAEAPRLTPYREAIRERIAAIAGLSLSRVSLKATTTERLGFTGRGEGIAAQASATIRLKTS